MDRPIGPEKNCVSDDFINGIHAFIRFSCNQPSYQERGTLLCSCARCRNMKQRDALVRCKRSTKTLCRQQFLVSMVITVIRAC